MICAFAGVPYISYQQNNWPWIGKINPFSIGMLYYCKKAKKVIGVSDHIIEEFRFSNYIRDKYVTLPNVVDLSRVKDFAGEPPESKTYDLCYFGRMSPQKSPSTFVNVVKKVLETRPETTTVMIGSGELTDDVKNQVKELGLDDKIKFTGFLKNPFEAVQKSRLLVMTSFYEGHCLAVIEAMSLGLPVIARNAPGLRQEIDESCGVLCNTENEFYQAILSTLSDEELYNKMSNGAKAKAKMSGDVERYAINLERICAQVVERS